MTAFSKTLLEGLESEILKIREDFPILSRTVRDNVPLVYLDNAATTQKPQSVIDSLSHYYANVNSNIHRGIHALSEEATELYESAHQKVSNLLNAKFEEVVFVKNTTEAVNIVANHYRETLNKGDEIVISRFEHHSNLVPFQQIANKTGAVLRYVESVEFDSIDLNSAEKVINDKTKLVAITHMSNVLGTITPVEEITKLAHDHGAKILLDAAQSVPHMPVNVKDIDCDFLAFSGHKMLAPMGTGGLYGKEEELEQLTPLLYGGEMIRLVTYEDATWNELPWKFEAGTPNVGGSVALGTAVDYLNSIGMDKVRSIEHSLTSYAMDRLSELDYVTVYGPSADERGGVVSFNLTGGPKGDEIHAHDVSTLLDEKGIAMRAGHHCAQPLMKAMEISATCRISFYIYNTKAEIDKAVDAIEDVQRLFNR